MKRILLAIAAAAFTACLPGQGENQSCLTTADCQVHMICYGSSCLGGAADAGSVCKNECTGGASCPSGEVCVEADTPCARCEAASAADGG